jgi:hypothetical protein
MFKAALSSIWDTVDRRDEDDTYTLDAYMENKRQKTCEEKELEVFVVRKRGKDNVRDSDVFRCRDDAKRHMMEKYEGKEWEIKQEKMNRPEKYAVVEFVLRQELEKMSDKERSVKKIDKPRVAAILCNTLKELEFDNPICALESLEAFLYFGGFEKASVALEPSTDLTEKQILSLISCSYEYACRSIPSCS